MSWSLKLDEPIVLANGEALHTLRDAGEYVTRLPKKEADLSNWQDAARCLLQASEKGRGLVVMATIAMLQALQAHEPQLKQTPRKKAAKKYRVVG